MPHFTRFIEGAGPLIKVLFTVSEARAAALGKMGRPTPTAPVAHGLVDTGASCTCVDPSILEALEFKPTGETQLLTPSTGDMPERADEYDCGLFIFAETTEHPYAIRNLPVVETPLLKQGFHALIGRDVLAKCVLIYNGRTNAYTLAF